MDDADLVHQVAAEFVERMGGEALHYLAEHAELAAVRGDKLSEEAWREIAAAVTRLLQ